MEDARYIIGIDLGTTNSALSYIDTHESDLIIHTLPLVQPIAVNEISAYKTLPSFVYFIPSNDSNQNKDDKVKIGIYAREMSQLQPERLISSSKSWLCHEKVDRRSGILPWHGAEDIEPLTPVQASSLLIKQMMKSWNQKFTQAPFQQQQIIITVPASFDETARALTAEAIELAGINHVSLLEEPQAAFYAWLYHHEKTWKEILLQHKTVLVCDIGGGTSDFSLIGVENENNNIQFKRIAVGDHLLLGGDNLDIALAYFLEPQFSNNRNISPKEWGRLINQCRAAKENLLQNNAPKSWPISISAAGKSLIASTIKIDVNKSDIQDFLLNGFLPQCKLNDIPEQKQSGFREFGLPYASDSAITKHLAAFLNKNLAADQVPSGVLFNGGFFEASVFKERILSILNQWYPKGVTELKADNLDLSVAQGATYFGLAKRGKIQKIEGGLPRATFIGILDKNNQHKALCLAPLGMEESSVINLDQYIFHLRVNMPVEFPIFSTKGMAHIKSGDLISSEKLTPGIPIRAFLKTGKKNKSKAKDIEVNLKCCFSALGTLEIFCKEKNGDRQWKLEFDTKNFEYSESKNSEEPQQSTPIATDDVTNQALEEIRFVFSDAKNSPDSLIKKIETITGKNRWVWDLRFLRYLWTELIENKEGRKLSPAHEERWLNFTGFCLRPGYGVEMDDWRVTQTWNIFMEGIKFDTNSQSNSEWFLFWNRIAGGLNSFQQRELASQYIAAMKTQINIQTNNSQNTNVGKAKKLQLGQGEKSQFYRMLGNLEELPQKDKREIINYILRQIKKFGIEDANYSGILSLGRIATRTPLYGSLNNVINIKYASDVLDELMCYSDYRSQDLFAIANIARKTGDRYRDLDEDKTQTITTWLKSQKAYDEHIQVILDGSDFTEDDRNMVFGEKLPAGLRLLANH